MHSQRDSYTTAKELFFGGLDALQAGRFAQAEGLFLQALQAVPDRPSVIANLCLALMAQEKHTQALSWAQRATELECENAQAWLQLGLCHWHLRASRADGATQATRAIHTSLRLNRDSLEAWQALQLSLSATNEATKALQCAENLCRLAPLDASHWLYLGDARSDLGLQPLAIEAYDEALRLAPQDHVAWHNKGLVLIDLNAPTEAIACFEQAIRIKPENPEAYLHRGQALHFAQRLDEAVASYQIAQSMAPDAAQAKFNESLAHLLKGDLKEGWQYFEARWAAHYLKDLPHQQWPQLASLKRLQNKRILVWHEQGFGDSLQFCRYLPLLSQLGAQISFEVQQALVGVLQSLSPAVRLIASTEAARQALRSEHFDAQIPLLNLPALMQTELDTIPPAQPLQHSPEHHSKWAARIRRAWRPRIGIACSGNPMNAIHSMKSMPLKYFAGIAQWADVYLIQTDLSAADEAELPHLAITWLGPQIDSFQDSAAIVEHMDLIISMDSSLAHLAGCMQRPLWLLLSHTPDWRWFLERQDSPWYPSARLFRQTTAGDWAPLFAALEQALAQWREALKA